MPITAFLEHLRSNNFKLSIQTPNAIITDTEIVWYEVGNEIVEIGTTKGRVWVNISEFKEISFDAIVNRARTTEQLIDCLKKLESEYPYNAYLETSDDYRKPLLYFIRIKPVPTVGEYEIP